ncbi:Rho guanine nucleotide exchange factor [Elasticomyces elasticus]|nr:Rho guanine nucleotide exchange factor [Elasticomyces elasticus]KAK3649477.1 Rho guanine nucleotide exchange factor [Elasticomyces elasticus]KAK4916999.1 Rho guanine nucleotide exchange factor [Elasticomyces elasticus]KAK5748988.1 Rho guanine nucleotide exchange factor [Elasticomyces elasticus]
MSYYQGTYQPPPPQRGYHDEHGQYHPPPPPPAAAAAPAQQNGGYAPQYAAAPQYPGQAAYDPYGAATVGGGPVQQPSYADPYGNSPQTSTFSGGGYGQQQYQYNPSQYAPPPPPQQAVPQYNPAAYAPTPTTYTPPTPYGYTPPMNYSGSQQYSPQPPYQPSPPAPQQQFPPYSPQPPSRGFSYSTQQPQRHTSTSQQQYGYAPQPPATMPYVPEPPHRAHAHAHSLSLQHQHSISPPAILPGLSHTDGMENWRPSPPGYQNNQLQHSLSTSSDTRQSPSPLYHTTTNSSFPPDFPSPAASITPGPTPPAHSYGSGQVSRSGTLDRHPSRPLPAPPEEGYREGDYFGSGRNGGSGLGGMRGDEEDEAAIQDELYSQVEDAVLFAGGSNASIGRRGHSPSISVSRPPAGFSGGDQVTPLFADGGGGGMGRGVQRNGSVVNGHLSPALEQGGVGVGGLGYSSDSDAEATQGLAMLQEAEHGDAWRGSARFSGGFGDDSQQHSRPTSGQVVSAGVVGGASDSDDYAGYDMSSFGGPDVQMSYGGNDPSQLVTNTHLGSQRSTRSGRGAEGYSDPVSSQHSSLRRSHASQSSHLSHGRGRIGEQGEDYDYVMDSIHPFPPFNPAARVDADGTGGLSEPNGYGRRLSYDDGDESALMDAQGAVLPERFPDEPPDIFFQAAGRGFEAGRPLPAVPSELVTDFKQVGANGYPQTPDAFGMNAQGQWVPRSTSMISHSATPQVVQPLRSKTDAEERRLRQQGMRGSVYTPSFEGTPASGVVPDLPSLGAKRFVVNKLGAGEFRKCEEPWGLGGLMKWLLMVVDPGQYTELKESEVKEALVALFTNKVPTMNIADAEGLSNHVVANMYAAGTLTRTEEWVKLVPGQMSGVIFQLTGHGCYSPTVHDHVIPGRCYSHHCQRTLKKVNLANQPARSGESWIDFYALKKEDIEGRDKKELERQNVLHEIVTTEDIYMEQLNVLRTLYRDTLAKAEPSIISPKRKEKFVRDVFGRVDAVKAANEEHLLPQLKYRQLEQGPWIVGFSDIFRQWIRKAKGAYLEYAGGFPGANFLVRQELDRNLEFRGFVDRMSKDKRSMRLQWDTFLKAPITRLQRYTLLLNTVIKNMRGEHLEEEKRNLQVAYDEVKNVTLECDARVAEMQRKVDLSDLALKLILRPGMQQAVELNLDHIGRQLIHRGDLQRMGGSSGNKFTFTWLDTHALLFDHYMVVAKTNARRSDQGGNIETYDVSRLPIPMDLLIMESTNDPAVQKSSYMKGFTSVTTVTGRGPTPDAAALARMPSNQGPNPGLQHVNTGASSASLQTVTSLSEGKDSDRIMWPFKIKHLGRETYTLFAPTEQARTEWIKAIREAKAKHAAALYAQHAEPFRLRVMADSAFVYDAFGTSGGQKADVVRGTPVDRAIKEVEHRFKDTGRPGPICRARVNCATSFTITGLEGAKQMIAVGTEFGVFVSEMENPRGWTKSIPMVKVTQIAVLEDFNLFLLITDKVLIAYPLDVICPNERTGSTNANDSARKAPQKLSGSKDVGLFTVGRQKDRTLVFYKKRENLNSVFKVLEPIYQKSTERKRGGAASLFRKGNYEFFREFDEFYIPTECTGMNIFHSSLAVSTSRGFEVLTLDKKQPFSIPDLRAQEVQNIAAHIKDQRALGMLRLSEQEFLLCYSNCAVYVNKHGEVSRSVIMDFVGNAQSAALYGAYLVLFDNDFVEIRNAQNGRLKQIIAGREIKCLDDGGSMAASGAANGSSANAPNGSANGPTAAINRTVKFVMQHPEAERTQIVVELLLNENMKE